LTKQKFILTTFALISLLIVLLILDISFGSINLFSLNQNDAVFHSVLYEIRLPKALTCIIAGSSLALCGLLMQSIFRNPLAGPYVLGVSSGASLFVAIATMMVSSISFFNYYFIGKSLITFSSVIGAFFVTIIMLWITKKNKNNVTVLLVGIMLSQILGAMQGLVEYLSNAESLKTFILWGMGNVGSTTLNDLFLILPVFMITLFFTYININPLNAIILNEQYATNLGINVQKLRVIIITITAILTGVITAFCGPIAFVGISVPIASRLFFKTSHHLHQITFTLLLGACVLLFTDFICQLLSNHISLPINTVTTIIGAPVVMYLLFKSKFAIS
jgi:iron complex transport system permease protein